jgi:membrane protein
MVNPVAWTIGKLKTLNDYIWHTPLSELSRRHMILIKQLRIVILAARGFSSDNVQLRASALTFYSLLSVVPVAAIAFALAKGFNLDQDLQKTIIEKTAIQDKELIQRILSVAQNAVQETKGGYIAGVGVIVLFWSVMSLLDRIESSFNHIWQISNPRPWFRKFADYLTIMLIAPILIILSGSVTIAISSGLPDFISRAPILNFFKPVVSFLIQFSPYIIWWFVLTVLFMVMPNTKVRFRSALVAGIIAGTILQLIQWVYLDLQVGITKLNTIYGSFAAIPLFIILLQSSWLVVLMGAEISFANQNVSRYELESAALNISNYHKRALTLLIMNLVIRNFATGEKPLSSELISQKLKIPVRLVRDIIQDLSAADLISIVHGDDEKERLFQPAVDINTLSVIFVLSRLDRKGDDHAVILKTRDYEKVNTMLVKFEKCMAKSDSNILIKDL